MDFCNNKSSLERHKETLTLKVVQAEVFEKNYNLIESAQLWTTFELHWHKHELQDVDTNAHDSTKT